MDVLASYNAAMRKLTALLLALTLITAPISSMIATAMGFSGEHVHYDHTWHTATDWAQANAAAHKAEHDHDGDHHDHNLVVVSHDSEEHHGDEDSTVPLKHSHADQVHAAPFVTVAAPQLLLPDLISAVAAVAVSAPVPQHPYPPFRPPQNTILV